MHQISNIPPIFNYLCKTKQDENSAVYSYRVKNMITFKVIELEESAAQRSTVN